MARREVLSCDRCKRNTDGLWTIDLGKDLTKPYEVRNDKSVALELCKACWATVFRYAKSVRDDFGREIDSLGQVKCAFDKCEARMNHVYADGTPRKHCSTHCP